MGKVTNIKLPNGFSISCESDDAAGVPDITQNAGENVMEAQDDAQKPVTQDAAEYDAAAEADTKSETECVQEVAKANESTFFGLAMMRRSQEGFGISKSFRKMKFSTPKDAINSTEIQYALKTAKDWANKKGYTLSTLKEIQENKQTLGTKLFSGGSKNMNAPSGAENKKLVDLFNSRRLIKTGDTAILVVPGGMLSNFSDTALTYLYVFFTKKDGKVISKKLAAYGNTRRYAEESSGALTDILNKEYATESINRFFGLESDDETEAPAETSDTETTVTAEETPAEEETTDVNVEAEAETEEEETTDVNVEAEAEETPAEEEKESSSEAEADEEEKAIENFFANWGL